MKDLLQNFIAESVSSREIERWMNGFTKLQKEFDRLQREYDKHIRTVNAMATAAPWLFKLLMWLTERKLKKMEKQEQD